MRGRFPVRAASVIVRGWKVLVLFLIAVGIQGAAAAPLPVRFDGGVPVTFGPDELVAARPGLPSGTFHQETAIAFAPKKNSRVMVAGSMEFSRPSTDRRPCVFAVADSSRAGWGETGVIPLQDLPGLSACSDPSVASGPDGSFYFAYVEQNLPDVTQFPTGEIRVARASGKGPWFQETVSVFNRGADSYPDKPYMVVDHHSDSPFVGTIYVTFTDLEVTGEEWIYVAASRDGAKTWSDPLAVNTSPEGSDAVLGSVPAVGPDGTVYVFWARFSYEESTEDILFSRSSDGGRSWSSAAVVTSDRKGGGFFSLKNADPTFGTASNRGLGVNGYPAAAVAADGSVFVAWTDVQDGSCGPRTASSSPACHNSDIRLVVSHDGGTTWSAPVKPTDETGDSDQFFPWLAAHPDGLVSLAWIDRRLDPDNIDYDVYYTNTEDGARFLPNVRVTRTSSILGTIRGIGDYNGIAATSKEVVPIWGDLRDGDRPQAYSAPGRLNKPAGKN
jgi:hypothetical protein